MEPYKPNEPFIKLKLDGSLLDRMVEMGIPLTRAIQYFRDNPEGSALETLKLAAEDVVPFYGNYRNNGDISDYAKEAAMLAMPVRGNLRAITGRDGKVRYVADEIVKADPVKTAEFDRVSRAQTEPYRVRDLPVEDVRGPYYHTPDYDQQRLLNSMDPSYHAFGGDNFTGRSFIEPSEYVDVYGDEITKSYSNKSLNPRNINRTINESDLYEFAKDKPLIEYGSEEWNNVQRAADEYKQFVNDNFNDRSSYIGHGQLGINELREPTVYSNAHRTPFEIYTDYINEHPFSEADFSYWKLEEPDIYNKELIRQTINRNNTDEVRNLHRYLRANDDALRLSDYKNIVRSIAEPTDLNTHIKVINSKIDKLTGDLLTDADKEIMKAEVNRMLPLIDNERDYATRNRLIKELINNLKAAGLDYADF